MERDLLEEARLALETAIRLMHEANGAEPTRSRELSVALTQTETGMLWLNRAVEKAAHG